MKTKDIFIIPNWYSLAGKNTKRQYQIILTENALYLVETGSNYSEVVQSVFSGVGVALDFVEGITGFVGGLANQWISNKLSGMFDTFAKNKSQQKINKVIDNLDEFARKGKWVKKWNKEEVKCIVIKQGTLFTGKSKAKFFFKIKEEPLTLFPEEKAGTQLLKSHLNNLNFNVIRHYI